MSTYVLGISAFYHDAAAAIVKDGEIIAAALEERFSRRKHDERVPVHAMNYCLEQAELDVERLDAIVFYDSPLLTWDRIVTSCIWSGEPSREQFAHAARSMLGSKVWVQSQIRRALGGLGRMGKVLAVEHHLSHAASAFYPSPFDRAAIVTIDGVGEWATMTVGAGIGKRVELVTEINYPHSLGLLYSAFTYFCGFRVNDGEYKLMGLAPYGTPRYTQLILDKLISLKDDGSFRLNTEYLDFVAGMEMTNDKFAALFGGRRRKPESEITEREMDMAASIQVVLDEAVLRIARYARRETGERKLVMAGGVALNCVANGKLAQAGVFDELWIQPAAGDSGGALGAALLTSHEYFGVPRRKSREGRDGQRGDYLGPAFTRAEVGAFLERHDLPHHVVSDMHARAAIVADALSAGKVTGYFSGSMEFGPRALGARSILADPRDKAMQSILNMKVKFRETFRPFAPAVLADRAAEYFDLPCASPFMLLVAQVNEGHRFTTTTSAEQDRPCGLALGKIARSDVAAVTHVDDSARIQTVYSLDSPELYEVIAAFEARTGCPLLINTSFNVRDEPIVCSPRDAYRCFIQTGLDLLVLEDCLLWKTEQPEWSQRGCCSETQAFEDAILMLDEELTRVRTASLAQEDLEREIELLFEQAVLRLHRGLGNDSKFLVHNPSERDAASYYVQRHAFASRVDFESVAYDDARGLAEAMHRLWSGDTKIGLRETIERHVKVAHVAAEAMPLDACVSASIYAMF